MRRLEKTKVYVGKFAEEIQHKAYSLGFRWSENKNFNLKPNSPFMYFDNNCTMWTDKSILVFNTHKYYEITAEEILSIKIMQNLSKLKPFTPVLVRKKENEIWKCDLLSHITFFDENPTFVATSDCFKYCVPYKGNESLVGKTY